MNIKETARNTAAAEIFSVMASEEKSKETIDRIRSMSDAEMDLMGKLSNVPDFQLSIFRSIMRGEENPLFERFSGFEDELKTGDLILVTGKSSSSKALVASQRPFYLNAKSSHVAVVHADFICVDAMPGPGVSNRLVSEVLADVEDHWRVIRFKGLKDTHAEPLRQRCAHYIMQPYKITLKRKRGKDYSYCSELARKVFEDCEIADTEIPQHIVVKPCDFDRIADGNEDWIDITEKVKPYIEFSVEFAPLLKVVAKLFIDGLKLNRARYEERRTLLKTIERAQQKGKMKPEKAAELTAMIRKIEESMHFTFWDFKNLGLSALGPEASRVQSP
ncbi:YiiX/YebB-like N1pC/P60 family cysteine hydrolase [Eoetvoesiella caeni]